MNSNEIQNSLFKAVEIIAGKQIEALNYNKTTLVTIINADRKDKGIYTVSDGVTPFDAYSENDSYSVGEQVYVLLLNGDYNNQKIILGRHLSNDGTSFLVDDNLKNFIPVIDDLANSLKNKIFIIGRYF